VDADNPGVQIIHRGKYKTLSEQEKRLLKRRQAIEPLIGHTKSDHRMDRCWLQGAMGDALHALCCAAGYNIRWLLRAITRLGLKGLFCALIKVAGCTGDSAITGWTAAGLAKAAQTWWANVPKRIGLGRPAVVG
jgi:IS5 family transposase